jgi:hypothetical protein
MSAPSEQSSKGFLRRFRDLVDELGRCENLSLDGAVRLGSKKVRFPGALVPVQIQLGRDGGKRLNLHPELTLKADGSVATTRDYLLYDPDGFCAAVGGFLRLRQGDALVLGRADRPQRRLLKYPKTVADRHLSLKLGGDGLVLKDLSPAHGTCISPLRWRPLADRLAACRREKLERLVRLFGGPLEPLPREEAGDLIEAVINLNEREPRQAADVEGHCGGVVALPTAMDVFFIGDLHARVDNLLVVLTQNGFLEGLESGTAALVILGDAVHPDADGAEEYMDSSMLMMDLIFRLKLAFPDRVFYLRGNHDSYSEEISKNGVPQGLLWEQALHEVRGASYARAMSRLYETLPYVALSRLFIACHAGAPTFKISRDMLINIRQYPKLEREITHVRLQKPSSPSGYNRSDVRRLRRRLELDEDTPLIVGHTPLSDADTLWQNAGGIPNHHVLFGAHPHWVGVIALAGGRLLPLRYPAEPLTELFNRIATG